MDYGFTVLNLYKLYLIVDKSCEYDSHANPVDCQLIIVDEGVKPAVERVYTIKNTIDYY